jgi:hypothetical protein
MAQLLSWDGTGDKFFETGVDRGVLYLITDGAYDTGFAWNGLVSVTENPSGAEPTKLYADNINYLNMLSAEEFGLTIEAYTYPDEFMACDGTLEAVTGTLLGQQPRSVFGLAYRTLIGNDEDGNSHGYKLHLVYGLLASPSEKAYSSINDSPEAITFSWECVSTPVAATGYSPVSIITIDSRTADEDKLEALEVILYGESVGPTQPLLPLPDAVITAMTPA